jgi:2-polyprenyl-3-methyl-5-hydroxy-6-metoxy-1,4-benzoquinol methylase
VSGPTVIRDCEICGSAAKMLVFRQRFAGDLSGALLTGYDVVVCEACGFGYADGLPAQTAFDEYYARMSKYEYEHQSGREAGFEEQRFPAAAEFIHSAAPDLRARVLDVGCSNGGLLKALTDLGYSRVLGLDPSPACAQAARRLHGLRVLTGTLSAPPEDIGRHDLLLLSAVLEHVRDLKEALAQVRGVLEPGGLLYVEAPDVTRFGGSPDAPFQEFSVEHINYFSPRSLRNLLRSAGFDQLASQTVTTVQGESTVADVIMAVFRAGDPGTHRHVEPDHETLPALEAYVAGSVEIEAGIHAALDPVVADGREIIVWGVGTHTQRLLAESPLGQARIAAFVDSNPRYQGKDLGGVPILAPAELRGRGEPILISSRFYQAEIERQLRVDLGLVNEVILLYQV